MDISPHKSEFVIVNGVRLHYLDWGGSGPVLLFLAGIGNNAHIFDGFAPRFKDQFHVMALTRRGHGESDYPETGYDIDTLTDDIRMFLECLGIDQTILVQHTNEGIELPHFAALYPDRVQKLVFLEPAYDRNSPMYKSMMEQWLEVEENVQFPKECWDNFDDYVYHHNKNFPVNAASWCEARASDLRHQMMIGLDGKIVYRSSGVSKARETMYKYTPEFARIQSPVLSIFPIRDETYYVLPFMTEEQKKQMIELYYAAQLPWFKHCIQQFRRDVPHAQVNELSHSHTYFFITHEDLVYKEMKTFFLDS
jgi:pimeloyl-ACP methyl ester carboxylesterase